MNTIRLSHGTTSRNLQTIRVQGLHPRGSASSNNPDCPSHPGQIYLSDCYAFHFAQNAMRLCDDLVVVECEVDSERLYPDENWVYERLVLAEYPISSPGPIRDEMEEWPKRKRGKMAILSLHHLGICSHRGIIPARQITRVAVVPAAEVFGIVAAEFDPDVKLGVHGQMRGQYQAFQESLFDRFPA